MRILREQTFAYSNILSHMKNLIMLNYSNKLLFSNKNKEGGMAELVDAPDSKCSVFPYFKCRHELNPQNTFA